MLIGRIDRIDRIDRIEQDQTGYGKIGQGRTE